MLFLVSYNFECFLRDQVIAGMESPMQLPCLVTRQITE